MSTSESVPSPAAGSTSAVRAYAQLLRVPAVFTAMSNVAQGFLFTHGELDPWPVFAALWLSSSALYLSGMVLNDVLDAELDARERPRRPIPSGRISRTAATRLGVGLLVVGIAAGWVASWLSGMYEPGVIATALAALVVLYDAVLKPTVLAPLGMGGCRTLNVLLGMSAATMTLPQLEAGSRWEIAAGMVAGGIGLYIVGVTWFARTEADTSHRGQLLLGTLVMLAGLAVVAWYPAWIEPEVLLPDRWVLLWLLIGAMVGARCGLAIFDPRAQVVQMAVRNCLLSLIIIDAAVVWGMAGSFWACAVALLVIPAMLVGRWISST
ncbi:MAG TPA: UbiA family prenyltransferase [Pirellulales bacterium]|nr:UbiA family prenyltransferase [Pirellulales bacterium]